MTHKEIVARLRRLAAQKPTDVYRAVLALADEIERAPEPDGEPAQVPLADDDIEALVRATQPPARPWAPLIPRGRGATRPGRGLVLPFRRRR
ncbi:hypothetical protein [Thermoactinospora rubra]|uniref:hypothetical protein n=1 Tax=Thermoactinospora rubra TaxID=1088767 RepID=UPI000A115793|nr:hypothetical protein [Thermoactinospora rubra]